MSPVLYVEDEENDVLLLRLAFQRAGITRPIEVVPDGKQAVDYLLGEGRFCDRTAFPLPDLVLLDLNLPQWDGFTVLQRIREHPQFEELRVLVFTSSEQPSDRARARECGASGYIVKPGKIEGLVACAKALQNDWLNSEVKGAGKFISRIGGAGVSTQR